MMYQIEGEDLELNNLSSSQVQIHDVSARRNPVWYVREGGGMTKNREVGNIIVDNKTADPMIRIQGGSHSGVYDGSFEADARDGAII